jgi:N-acylneuraminate cytidylyltransferase
LNESGQESVILNRKDGLAVGSFAKLGIPLLILSTEKNPVVAKRAEKLKVPYIQGATDKFSEIKSYLNEKQIDLLDVWYVGNDINDLEVMTHVGLSICPNDAVAEVLSIAQWVLKTKGGAGVLAEIVSNLKGIKK